MLLHERVDGGRLGRLADIVGHIDGVEVAGRQKALDRGEIDVIGVAEVRELPVKFLHGGVGRGADRSRLGADDGVLAI